MVAAGDGFEGDRKGPSFGLTLTMMTILASEMSNF
jgi:hypothetical protein